MESVQYTARAYEQACDRSGVVQSMGRVGSALDNAAAEAFNSTIKVEYIHRQRFRTRAEARLKIATWIVDFYNTKRRHSACQDRSPIDYERLATQAQEAEAAKRNPPRFEGIDNYREVLGEGIRLVVDTVTRIDAAERSVTLATGGTVGYDYLVYAVGSGSADPRVPGAAEFAYPIASLEEAERLRPVVDAVPATAAVTVVGAGPTGIETAAELAEAGRTVTLVCGGVLGPYLHPRGRRSVARRLAKLGVTVLDGPDAKVTAVTRDAVRLADGRELPSTVTIWTAGFGVPDLAARSGLSTDALGRLRTDETLTSVDDVRIVAAGDSAAPSDLPLRMSCQSARPLGAHAADTVLSRITGEQPARINVGFFGQCIGLGRRAATAQLASKDDTANGFYIGGRLAATIKETAIKGILKELANEARKPGSYSWLFKDDKRQQLLQAKRGEALATAEQAA